MQTLKIGQNIRLDVRRNEEKKIEGEERERDKDAPSCNWESATETAVGQYNEPNWREIEFTQSSQQAKGERGRQ